MLQADARALPFATGSVQCCVTSPPYWGLRDYGTAGQLGLEPTPDAYVAGMVAVFRQVWRVLRDDGVLFLNLGDSYASDTKGSGGPSAKQLSNAGSRYETKRLDHGLKAKDLVGIPWRVAFALQQPYYAGTIRDERDRIWLAAMLDAEGCMFIHKRKAGQHNGQGYHRTNDSYGPGIEIANTSLAVVERIHALVGKGSICSQGPEENGRRKQRIYRWNLRTTESREFVRELYPHLVAKQQQARILYGCPSSGERAEAAHAALMSLHRTGESGVDFPEPPSMFEPGYYLRSDIIWSKANPMPESVTDRPTKSHEYVFLLTKAERYFWNAEAVKEPYSMTSSTAVADMEGRTARGRDGFRSGAKMAAQAEGAANGTAYGRTSMMNAYGNGGRNVRSVWNIATQPYAGAHFATMPEKLVERCVLAGSKPGDVVLDPFLGSGTVARVATSLGRKGFGAELNREYLRLARERTHVTRGLPLGA
jgi:DNA modification methylase